MHEVEREREIESYGVFNMQPFHRFKIKQGAQWLGICLSVQGILVQFRVQELRSHLPQGN